MLWSHETSLKPSSSPLESPLVGEVSPQESPPPPPTWGSELGWGGGAGGAMPSIHPKERKNQGHTFPFVPPCLLAVVIMKTMKTTSLSRRPTSIFHLVSDQSVASQSQNFWVLTLCSRKNFSSFFWSFFSRLLVSAILGQIWVLGPRSLYYFLGTLRGLSCSRHRYICNLLLW